MEKKTDKFDFEKALKRLEAIVDELDEKNPPLQKALELFQEGKKISQALGRELTRFEQKIQKIIEDQEGDIALEDFAPLKDKALPGEDDQE